MHLLIEFLLSLIFSYCYGSAAEWFAHSYLLHQKNQGFPKWIYQDHMNHHKVYKKDAFNTGRDYGNIDICLEHSIFFILPAFLIALLFNNYILTITLLLFAVVHWHLYRQVHGGGHLRWNKPKLIPSWYYNECMRQHYLHHLNPKKFYNVSLLGADYLFNTHIKMTKNEQICWDLILHASKVSNEQKSKDEKSLDLVNKCLK